MAYSDPYYATKEHKDWRTLLIARDKGCVICNSQERLNAHHLIPHKFKKLRSNIMNGVMLCPSHHTKMGFKISPHSHGSMLFAAWMMKNRPEQFKWVMENWDEV